MNRKKKCVVSFLQLNSIPTELLNSLVHPNPSSEWSQAILGETRPALGYKDARILFCPFPTPRSWLLWALDNPLSSSLSPWQPHPICPHPLTPPSSALDQILGEKLAHLLQGHSPLINFPLLFFSVVSFFLPWFLLHGLETSSNPSSL